MGPALLWSQLKKPNAVIEKKIEKLIVFYIKSSFLSRDKFLLFYGHKLIWLYHLFILQMIAYYST